MLIERNMMKLNAFLFVVHINGTRITRKIVCNRRNPAIFDNIADIYETVKCE